jgi:hypothetical protein
MSVERGACQDMLKNEFFHFFVKKIWTYRWNWLEKWYYWWNLCWIFPRGCPEMAVFRLKKGHFLKLISRRKSWLWPETPTNRKYKPSTCRVYLVQGVDGQTPGPENPSELNPLHRSPKCSNIQWIVEVLEISWVSSDSPSYKDS